ncbi:MAG: amidohydrolase family protein [Planctomycetes bacterium]|nr:amidohydrolase family protein [Planctomycetota bacterium]
MPRTRIKARRIWTGDPARPFANSVTVDGGTICGIDDSGPVDRELDGGAFVGPAFIDSHLHLMLGGRSLEQAQLAGVASRQEFDRVIRAKHESLSKDRWLEAGGWDQGLWGEMPDQSWLACCGDRPAIAWRMDQHVCVVNRAALEIIGKQHNLSVDPAGGTIARDAKGSPTGLLLEQAAWKYAIPCVPMPDAAALREAARAAARHLHAHGIATVGSMEYSRDLVGTLDPLRRELGVRIRATILDREWPVDWNLGGCVAADDALTIIGFKSFIDGTLGSRTARMLEPYSDEPASLGLFVELAESGKLAQWLREGLARGWSMSMHAIGDAALRAALDAADAAESAGVSAREALRIEHGQTAHPSDLPRCKGRWLSMQPLHKYYDAAPARTRLGPSRMDRFFSFRQLQRAGARLAFGSDWPIVPPDCLQAMQTAIVGLAAGGTLTRAEASISAESALRAFTCDAAKCLRADRTCGSIGKGLTGDLVSLDCDPLANDWHSNQPKIRFTLVAGEVAP